MPVATIRRPRFAAAPFAALRLAVILFAMAVAPSPSAEAQAPATVDGRSVYLRACAYCHGAELQGRDAGWDAASRAVPPLDSRGKAWRMSDGELAAVVAGGSHALPLRLSGAAMPPLGERLSAAEIAAALAYIKESWSASDRRRQAETTRRADAAPAALVELGGQLYAAKCAICHGAAREGQSHRVGDGAAARVVRIPALRAGGLASLLGDESLAAIIGEGEARHPAPYSEFRMPSLRFEPDDVRALVAYLRQAWRDDASAAGR